MKALAYKVRRYPLTAAVVVAIWVLCLMPIPETPLDDVSFIDKWTHLVMFGGLTTVIWGEYALRHKQIQKKRLFVGAFVLPWLMGGLVEIVQATCTNGVRSGDVADFLADGAGVILGQLAGMLLARVLASYRKDS